MAASVRANGEETTSSTSSSSAITTVTAQQLEKLIKMLPTLTKGDQSEEDDIEINYSSMVSYNLVRTVGNDWIVDSGATHHMTSNKRMLTGLR